MKSIGVVLLLSVFLTSSVVFAETVQNPEEPPETISITLDEQWRRGGEDDDVLFGVVSQLVQDKEGNVYLLDGQLSEVQVLSPGGEHLRTIGREGEGPGEFRNASDMYLGPGGTLGVLQIFPGKIVMLETDGTPAGNFPLPGSGDGGFNLIFVARATPDRVLVAGADQSQEAGKQVQINYLRSYDPDGNVIARFHDESNETRFGGMKFNEKTFSNFARRWALRKDGRVAAALDFDDYRIHVWNADGTVNHIIERPDFAPLERTEEQLERFQKLFDGVTSWNPGSSFEVSATHSAVNQLWYREDGTLWVLSSRGTFETADGVFASLDVYDEDGKYIRRVDLVMNGDPVEDGLFFGGDQVYLVTDLFSAFMANMGGDVDEAEEEEQPEPVQIIAFSPKGD
jgi:hypothetical protein